MKHASSDSRGLAGPGKRGDAAGRRPAAAVLAVIVGVGQTVYTVLKPTGALDWLEELGSPERAEV